MQIHGFVAFAASVSLDESGPAALDLHAATGFLLDMLHVRPAMADHLGTQVEARHGFQIDVDALFRPFALQKMSQSGHPSIS